MLHHHGFHIDALWERVFPMNSWIARFQNVANKFLCLLFSPVKMWQQILGPNELFPATGQRFILYSDGCRHIGLPLQTIWQCQSLSLRSASCVSDDGCRGRDGALEPHSKCPLHLFFNQIHDLICRLLSSGRSNSSRFCVSAFWWVPRSSPGCSPWSWRGISLLQYLDD